MRIKHLFNEILYNQYHFWDYTTTLCGVYLDDAGITKYREDMKNTDQLDISCRTCIARYVVEYRNNSSVYRDHLRDVIKSAKKKGKL